ncbi:mannose-1-phosphate guanylyltransferase/mannose-6-phosphate isomerase [Methylohalomonas lacus]|uniref:mannose-1-phosphate guanylyltransferase n=1 Tax=Methylohalomonas lacus TaxID=398773 RepID=A0AAE3HN27_9GAMM|nr:mannose-1-phosphate guanylyltransferase/mannose-6-phosphate isomerase [Methylohalomonas lacus]MCS3903572.1 mannose-1-phosphate guanylyltransferase/mannose-6-phosphate isomerase [Methylohalomonas lacus]
MTPRESILPIILSGGMGDRLWPLSRQSFPKQFLSLAGEKSLLQETVERLSCLGDILAPPVFVSNKEHRFLIAQQASECRIAPGPILLEPVARNTAPAVAAAALEATREDHDPLLLVLPADHIIRDTEAFATTIEQAVQGAAAGALMTFGVVPAYAETGYGYIAAGKPLERQCAGGELVISSLRQVEQFVEKPDQETAEYYLTAGNYLWNSGMFLFRASRYLDELDTYEPEMSELCREAHRNAERERDFIHLERNAFAQVHKESIDYAVMEHTRTAGVVALDAGWSDVGSWSILHDVVNSDCDNNQLEGDVLLDDVNGSYIRAENRMVAAVGLQDHIIVETRDAVLVATKDRAQDVKRIVSRLRDWQRSEANEHALVHRPWGTYETVNLGERHKVKHITINPGASLSLQMHNHRAEHWVIVKGTGKVTCGDETFVLGENQSAYIPAGETHRLENLDAEPLELVEVQSGSYLGEDDIVRFHDNYGRTN